MVLGSSHPCTSAAMQMVFNESFYGFVPHGGTTYYLSRMPG